MCVRERKREREMNMCVREKEREIQREMNMCETEIANERECWREIGGGVQTDIRGRSVRYRDVVKGSERYRSVDVV